VFRQTNPATVTAVGIFPGQRIVTLHAPAGKYTVAATAVVRKNDGYGTLRCNTFASAGGDGNVLLDDTFGNVPGTVQDGTMSGMSVETVAPGGDIEMWCRQLNGQFGSFPVIIAAEIVASSVADYSTSEDEYGG